MSRRAPLGTLVLLSVLAAALSLVSTGSAGAPPPPAGFVQVSGTSLTLSGQPYRFTGINIYNAANGAGCWYPMTERLDARRLAERHLGFRRPCGDEGVVLPGPRHERRRT